VTNKLFEEPSSPRTGVVPTLDIWQRPNISGRPVTAGSQLSELLQEETCHELVLTVEGHNRPSRTAQDASVQS